jgi:hypothetical protein
MATVFSILMILAGLASFIFFIMVLIKLFQEKGALHGILGILCGLYTFIWGWISADRLGIKQTMIYWTLAIVAQIVFQVLMIVFGGGAGAVPTLPK